MTLTCLRGAENNALPEGLTALSGQLVGFAAWVQSSPAPSDTPCAIKVVGGQTLRSLSGLMEATLGSASVVTA